MSYADKKGTDRKRNLSTLKAPSESVCPHSLPAQAEPCPSDKAEGASFANMGKDPAVLFYTSDFLAGTMTMANEHVGMYIRLLCLQHQKGLLKEKDMLYICGTYVEDVFCKFEKDSHGNYFNKRLLNESLRRKEYSESRRKNRMSKTSKSYVEHMETETETITKNTNRNESFKIFWKEYPHKVGKRAALRMWERLALSNGLSEKIMKAVEAQKKWPQWNKEGGRFIPNPATWLNQGRWDDEFEDKTCKKCNGKGVFVSSTGYEIDCDCPEGKLKR